MCLGKLFLALQTRFLTFQNRISCFWKQDFLWQETRLPCPNLQPVITSRVPTPPANQENSVTFWCKTSFITGSNGEIRWILFLGLSTLVLLEGRVERSVNYPDQVNVLRSMWGGFSQTCTEKSNLPELATAFVHGSLIKAFIQTSWNLQNVVSEFCFITLSSAGVALYLVRHKFGSISKLQQSIWDQWGSWSWKFGWNFNCKGNFRPIFGKISFRKRTKF